MEKKAKRRLPLAVKIILGLLVVVLLCGGGLFAKMSYEQSIMTPLPTGEVIPGVYAVNNGFVNSYLVSSGEEYLMVDGGNDLGKTESALLQLGIPAEKVKAVLLTHSDADHVASLSLFPAAQVYLPALESQMIDGTTRRSPMGYNHLDREVTFLEDGQELEALGKVVRCFATPGHTPGSMSYLFDGYLFVVDSLSLQEGKAAPFNAFDNMDSEVQKESIKKLAANAQGDYIFAAHYGCTDDPESAFADWR